MKRTLAVFSLIALALATRFGAEPLLRSGITPFSLDVIAPSAGTDLVPFFEVMSPLPGAEGVRALPELEYKKGPPQKYIERLVVKVFGPGSLDAQERVVFHGRRTRGDALIRWAKDEDGASFVAHALRFAHSPGLVEPGAGWIERLVLLLEARRHLSGVRQAWIMDQAGTPAILLRHDTPHFTAIFARKKSFYRIDWIADRGFRWLDPLELFARSFVVESRRDAMEYLAGNLARVRMKEAGVDQAAIKDVQWPLSLLAGLISVDPSSVDGYFHFAGISALLFKSRALDAASAATLDVLRNNVLASEFYARDVAPDTEKTREIGRLVRSLTRSPE
ncbi:MAG: hypothetical protein HUU37_06105 [Bdellovibrionales bacterium]|nr:hypothetical protein [Bdellovibrionales bacterium]